MKFACLQNHPSEGPAAIGDWIWERKFELGIFECFSGEFPEPDDFDGLIVMGGPMSVSDASWNEAVAGALEAVRIFLETGKPILGICLGAQMLAFEAGGNVIEGPEKEIGWYPVRIHRGQGEHLLSDVPDQSVVFHWHGEQIELPRNATLLASTPVCPVQAFHLREHQLGLQCHWEVTHDSLEGMVSAFEGELLAGGPGVESEIEIMEGCSRYGPLCRDQLNHILDRWLAAFSG